MSMNRCSFDVYYILKVGTPHRVIGLVTSVIICYVRVYIETRAA